jgi:hypothetical protein
MPPSFSRVSSIVWRWRLIATSKSRATSAGIATAALSIVDDIFISWKGLVFFLILAIVISFHACSLLFAVGLGLEFPESPLVIEHLSALHFLLLLDFVVNDGASQNK